MSDKPIRVGIVGAGNNTKLRHIPGLVAQPGVEIVSVANRSRASSLQVAQAFDIPTVYDHWRALVEADDSDAICIGTWPYLHAPVTIAALRAGKHVLCEARMAMDAREARAMLAESRSHPHLVAQLVPSPFTLRVDRTVQENIAEGFLGDWVAISVRANTAAFAEADGPLHWRHVRDLSGYNILMMGIWYEALMRWAGEAVRVLALTKTVVRQRRDDSGRMCAITVPDHVDILCDMVCGAQAHLQFSAVTGPGEPSGVWLYGREGTLHYDATSDRLFGARRGDTTLHEIPIPPEKTGRWRVEEEFVRAVRGLEPVTHTRFEDGVRYMEFTEAVTRSARTGCAVALPLTD